MAMSPSGPWSPASTDHRLYPRSSRIVGAVAELHLNRVQVGTVVVTGWDASWGFGRFTPGPGFEPFATAYGLWSLLMHEDGTGRLARSTAADLAVVENAIDRIRARLYFTADDTWVDPFQLNIDGELLEWKEY
jgi:hypothetical protein